MEGFKVLIVEDYLQHTYRNYNANVSVLHLQTLTFENVSNCLRNPRKPDTKAYRRVTQLRKNGLAQQ